MLKTFSSSFENFIENYSGSIKNKLVTALNKGVTKFIFNGPSGSGKNFLAEALSSENGFTLEKINAYTVESDDKEGVSDKLVATIRNSAISTSLFGNAKKVVYVEDAEKVLSLDSTIFKKVAAIPGIIIFESTSGDIFRSKYKSALGGYEIIRLYKLNSRAVRAYILRLMAINKMNLDYKTVDDIVRNSKGNLTSVITDLKMIVLTGKNSRLYPRYSEDSIFTQLTAVFSGDYTNANVYFSSDLEAKNFEIWLADKAPSVVKGDKLYKFFERLSSADIILNKIRKQNWGLMRYVQSLLVFGASVNSPGSQISINYSAPDWNTYYRAG